MVQRRHTVLIFIGLLVGISLLFGCRAFDPEVVIVNKRPETYITGAPAETTGGLFHFHVYWYGTDADGTVERFVWALTDTTLQDYDPNNDEDEEDQRFNPALNISTLEIGNWTTRTDTVFDFQIGQGANLSYDMTLHMVAVDDRGDYDRTPARLYFISNALDNPRLEFRIKRAGDADFQNFASFDTVAYGESFSLTWSGSTPNIDRYDPVLLAIRDTVPPIDGLYGYKFRVQGDGCDDALEDCWKPRFFDEDTGDSVSFFGARDSLYFANEDPTSEDVFRKRLASGVQKVLVNTIDVAGVEVQEEKQELNVVVNYDPDTILLRNQRDPFYTDDPHTYPYYLIFDENGEVSGEFSFTENDTVPDGSYVVFKALARDDPRDLKLGEQEWDVLFQGRFDGTGRLFGIAPFPFGTEYSQTHRTPDWEPTVPGGWSADTLGFLVGPFEYNFEMRAVDELGRREKTPDTFRFYGNRPPCVQGIELLNYEEGVTDADLFADCAARNDTVGPLDEIFAYNPLFAPPPDRHTATSVRDGNIYYKLATSQVWLSRPRELADVDSIPGGGKYFGYRLALKGKDNPLDEIVRVPEDRIRSWRYEIKSERDPSNQIPDGGGIDDLTFVTYDFVTNNPNNPIYVDEDGVWFLRVEFFVPTTMLFAGEEVFRQQLLSYHGDVNDANLAFDLITVGLGLTSVRVKARDQSSCDARSDHGEYHFYTQVRVPEEHGTGCGITYGDSENNISEAGRLALDDFARESTIFKKQFWVRALLPGDVVFP